MSKQPLSRDLILGKAGTLMKQHGIEAVTIRRLAEQLDVTPMAIYRHFADKDTLLGALLDRFIRDADVLPRKALPWDQWLRHVGRAMWTALVAEPDWISLLGSLRLRAGGLTVLAEGLELFKAAGFSGRESLEMFFSMVHISIGAACLDISFRRQDSERPFDADEAATMTRILGSVQSMDMLLEAHHIDRSLKLLVEGLKARRRIKSV